MRGEGRVFLEMQTCNYPQQTPLHSQGAYVSISWYHTGSPAKKGDIVQFQQPSALISGWRTALEPVLTIKNFFPTPFKRCNQDTGSIQVQAVSHLLEMSYWVPKAMRSGHAAQPCLIRCLRGDRSDKQEQAGCNPNSETCSPTASKAHGANKINSEMSR